MLPMPLRFLFITLLTLRRFRRRASIITFIYAAADAYMILRCRHADAIIFIDRDKMSGALRGYASALRHFHC